MKLDTFKDIIRTVERDLLIVTLTGGEPTLHPQLEEMVRFLREKGLLVRVNTNGVNPVLLKELDDRYGIQINLSVYADSGRLYKEEAGGYIDVENTLRVLRSNNVRVFIKPISERADTGQIIELVSKYTKNFRVDRTILPKWGHVKGSFLRNPKGEGKRFRLLFNHLNIKGCILNHIPSLYVDARGFVHPCAFVEEIVTTIFNNHWNKIGFYRVYESGLAIPRCALKRFILENTPST